MTTLGKRRSHRVMVAIAVASVTSGALVACNLITGLDADYSASAHDGATSNVGEAGGTDAPGSDGPAGDGAVVPDAMVKPDAGDAGLTAWCRSVQNGSPDEDFFCTDFEGATFPDPAGWTGVSNERDAGTLTFIEVDASRTLDVTGASNGTFGAHTRLLKILAGDPHQYLHYELDYDVRLASSTLQYGALGLLTFASFSVSAKEHGVATYGPGAPASLSQQGGTGALAKAYPNDAAWHHVKVTLDRGAADTSYTRTIHVDGVDVDGDPSTHAIVSSDPTEISIGIFNGSATVGSAHAQFDNVVFRRKP